MQHGEWAGEGQRWKQVEDVALILLKQARFDGGPSYSGGDRNVEKLANLWYSSETELVVFGNALDVGERKEIKTLISRFSK